MLPLSDVAKKLPLGRIEHVYKYRLYIIGSGVGRGGRRSRGRPGLAVTTPNKVLANPMSTNFDF